MLRKFRLPKIKNCLLEEYNQKALLGVSLFCFGSDASVFRITVVILRNLENKLPAGNIRKLLMELMLRKFCLPKIKIACWRNTIKKLSLFCFGSDASVRGLRISLLSFGFLYLISALLLMKKLDVSFAFAYCVSKSYLEDQSHFFLRKDLPSVPSSHDALEKMRIICSKRSDCRLFSPFARRSQSSSVYNNNCCNPFFYTFLCHRFPVLCRRRSSKR